MIEMMNRPIQYLKLALPALILVSATNALAKTPVQLLEEAAERWEQIQDYTAYFRQTNIRNDEERVFLGRLFLCRTAQAPGGAYLRLDYFETRTDPAEQKDGVEVIETERLRDQYFSDGETLWHYRPKDNRLSIENLDIEGPFPEILLMAGFLEINVDEFRETHTFRPLEMEMIRGRPTHKLTIEPRRDEHENEPLRHIWIDQETLLPARVVTEGEITVIIDLSRQKTDQALDLESMMPMVPETVEVIDVRHRTAVGNRMEGSQPPEAEP